MVRRAAAILLFIAATAAATAEPQPSFAVMPGRVVAATLPDQLLGAESIAKQLDSGLTTIFVLTAQAKPQRGAARMEIRYDMWDEVWLVRRIEFDGRTDSQRLSGREALGRWWRTPVRLFSAAPGRLTIDLQLVVLPFSATEERDARNWLSKSGGVALAPATGFVDALIGTTISARPVVSYRWRAELSVP